MRVAICDNVDVCCEVERLLRQYFVGIDHGWIEIKWYHRATALAEDLATGSPFDVVFCDIAKPYELLATMERNFILVVLGTQCLEIEKLFLMQVHFFMKKPIDSERFFKMVGRLYKLSGRDQVYLEVRQERQQRKLRVDDILYVESRGRKMELVLSAGERVATYAKMRDMEQVLLNKNIAFLRLHHSYLVNFRKIYSCIGHNVRLRDGTMLPISRERYALFREEYLQLMDNEGYVQRMLKQHGEELG